MGGTTQLKSICSTIYKGGIYTFRNTPLTFLAFSRYILYLSSIAFISSSFFRKAASSSPIFWAIYRNYHQQRHIDIVLPRLLCSPDLTTPQINFLATTQFLKFFFLFQLYHKVPPDPEFPFCRVLFNKTKLP